VLVAMARRKKNRTPSKRQLKKDIEIHTTETHEMSNLKLKKEDK
jgi:hypothetical protein